MILFVTPSERARECAAALQETTGEPVRIAESLARANTLLRADCFLAVVLDQYLLETQPDEAATTLEHLGTAVPVQINLAICGMERLVREVRAAVQRRKREEVGARQAALAQLHSELSGTVTALSLSVELAMEALGRISPASEQLELLKELVTKLRQQLESSTDGVEEAIRGSPLLR